MSSRPPLTQLDGVELRNLFSAGAVWLERNVGFVNSLNVFPVPDGDTGTNMLLTVQAAIREAHAADTRDADKIAAALSYGALLGARGNSGVILSQIMRGLARTLEKHPILTASLFAQALGEGARTAYKGVVKPVEGTILTVVREAGDGAMAAAAASDDLRVVLRGASDAARTAVLRTPQLLPVLKQAQVVDAGGEGLALILDGATRYLDGEPLALEAPQARAQNLDSFTREEGWGYDIQFHIRGQNLPVEEIRETIAAMGESALIVGDESLVKVHIHARNPGPIIQYGADQGALVNILIENMQAQYVDFKAGSTADTRIGAENLGAILPREDAPSPHVEPIQDIATIAVTPGEGVRTIFESLGISATVNGGPTMNPSARDLLDAIDSVTARGVILLPNDKNIILAANQAGDLSSKTIRVIPSLHFTQGIAALLAFNFQADLDSNINVMTGAMRRIRTVEVTHATRAAEVNGIRVDNGQPIALLDGELTAANDRVEPLIVDALQEAGAQESEVITLYYGSQVTPADAEPIRSLVMRTFPDQEVEIYSGGQPLYPYVFSIE